MALAPRAGVDSFTSRPMQTKDYEPSVLREVPSQFHSGLRVRFLDKAIPAGMAIHEEGRES